MRTILLLITGLLAFGGQFSPAASQTLNIEVCNIKPSREGVILMAFFTDEKAFRAEDVLFFRSFDKSRVKDGRMTVEISVKCGIYGISVIDDENNNGKMEYNLLGIPKEGFGFSNFNLKKMRKPRFSDFSFIVAEKEVKDIKIKMKYF